MCESACWSHERAKAGQHTVLLQLPSVKGEPNGRFIAREVIMGSVRHCFL